MDRSFQRARSADDKRHREAAILAAARGLAGARGVRDVTLTDVAAAVGLHKSAMLRYFETREQIFLTLAADDWREWSAALRAGFTALPHPAPATVARLIADSLVDRPLFCDLLAHTALSLERNVSAAAVLAFKRGVLAEVDAIAAELGHRLGLSVTDAVAVVTTATGMAGALWQMANLHPDVRAACRSDPGLEHSVIEVGPRLAHILAGLVTGYAASPPDGTGGPADAPPA